MNQEELKALWAALREIERAIWRVEMRQQGIDPEIKAREEYLGQLQNQQSQIFQGLAPNIGRPFLDP